MTTPILATCTKRRKARREITHRNECVCILFGCQAGVSWGRIFRRSLRTARSLAHRERDEMTRNFRKGTKGAISIPLEQRFWEKVNRRGEDECWPWLGSQCGRGYGQIYVAGRNRKATQVSWELSNGTSFPEGMCACHSCDNPPCVNPRHIWPGTMKQNTQDARDKGRLKGRRKKIRKENRVRFCKRGHEFTPENTRIRPSGARFCIACQKYHRRRRTLAGDLTRSRAKDPSNPILFGNNEKYREALAGKEKV